MTKKDYIKLAEIINNNLREGKIESIYGNIREDIKQLIDLNQFCNDLVIFLKEDNPNFNVNKFWDAVHKDAIVSE